MYTIKLLCINDKYKLCYFSQVELLHVCVRVLSYRFAHKIRDAPDSVFYHPAGYRICRIVEKIRPG